MNRHLMRQCGAALLLAAGGLLAAPAARADSGVEFFERKVRPILVEHCHQCHSAAKKQEAHLLLDSRDGMLKGGDSGPAVIPGRPDKSRLVRAVGYEDVALQMPPRGKLSAEQIADLTRWVEIGAPWPAGTAVKPAVGPDAKPDPDGKPKNVIDRTPRLLKVRSDC